MSDPFFDWQLDNEDPETSEYINEPEEEEETEPEDETVYDYEDTEDDYDD